MVLYYSHNSAVIDIEPNLISCVLCTSQRNIKQMPVFERNPARNLKYAAMHLPCVLDPTVMKCSEFCAFFRGFFSRASRFFPQMIVSSGYEIARNGVSWWACANHWSHSRQHSRLSFLFGFIRFMLAYHFHNILITSIEVFFMQCV